MTLGDVSAKIVANTKDFDAKMDGVGKKVNSVAGEATSSTSKIGTALSAVGSTALVVATAIGGAFAVITKTGIGVAGQLESAEQGFKALLGSADEAGKVMDRIKREAALTPFELTGLTAGVQALTAITKDGDRAVDILLDVGKAVAISGKGSAELDRVILNLQQISATGKVTEMDIRQFQSAIPIFNDIIGAVGLTTDELKEADNSAELLFDAFQKAGMEGGIAAEGFSSQAGTWNQLVSNMKDTWAIFASDFVQKLGIFDIAKEALTVGMELLDKYGDKLLNWLIPALSNTKDWFQETWKTIKEFWDLYGQPVFDMVVNLINNTIIPAWQYLKEQIQYALEESGYTMEDFKKLLGIIATVIGGVVVGSVLVLVAAIGGLIFVIAQLIKWGVDLNNKMKEVWQNIKNEVQWHVDRIKEMFGGGFTNFIISSITYPFEVVGRRIKQIFDGIKNAIQSALDLTQRHSPSVIDRLKKGVYLAEKEFDKLGNVQIAPISQVFQQGVMGNTGGGINLSVNMAGANISSPEVAERYAEQIGDAIVGKLRTNRRSYG